MRLEPTRIPSLSAVMRRTVDVRHVRAQAERDGRELLVEKLPRRQLRVDPRGNFCRPDAVAVAVEILGDGERTAEQARLYGATLGRGWGAVMRLR